MDDKLEGRVIDRRDEQPVKAPPSIDVTPLGTTIDTREEQL
jgi:hypothetical protein